MRECLAAIWRRAEAWLRREAYVRAAVEAAAKRAFLEGHDSGQRVGYQVGLAHGELKGRRDLATELETAHGVGGGEMEMTPLELGTLRIRQLH